MTNDTERSYGTDSSHRRTGWTKRAGGTIAVLAIGILPSDYDASAQVGPGSEASPEFVEVPCAAFEFPTALRTRARCGTVSVPRVHGSSESGTYDLAVAVVSIEDRPGSPDPLLFLPGGPGNAAIQPGLQVLANWRDLILVDPRGAGASEPDGCGGLAVGTLEITSPDYSTAEILAALRALRQSCVNEARRRGVMPEHFGSVVTVEDLELVRRALGVDRWNVIGSSHGTVTGLALAARYPERIRSLILDSIVPFDRVTYVEDRLERAIDAFLNECRTNAVCAEEYPELADELESVLAELETTPLAVTLPAESGSSGNEAILNRADLEFIVFGALYNRQTIARLPFLVDRIAEGSTDEAALALAGIDQLFPGISMLTFLSVLCRDFPAESAFLNSRPETPESGVQAVLPAEVCSEWAAPALLPEFPVSTSVRTLVLGGTLDPATSSQEGREATLRLGPAARFVEFPSVGHGTLSQPCAYSIIQAFLDDPDADLDVSCTESIPAIVFAIN